MKINRLIPGILLCAAILLIFAGCSSSPSTTTTTSTPSTTTTTMLTTTTTMPTTTTTMPTTTTTTSTTTTTTTTVMPTTTSTTLPATTTTITPAPAYTINIATKGSLGTFLVNNTGKTLYWTTRDVAGQSNVTGDTLTLWPVFYIPNIIVPEASLNATDFGSITRPDLATKQTAFKGWPLYFYSKDTAPGDTNGQGVGGVWWVVNPVLSAPLPAPTLSILVPVNGVAVPQGDIRVNIRVTNFKIVDKQGQAIVPGEGHVHYFLDVDAPTTPGQPAIPASGTWAHVAATSYTFTSVPAGTHTISVELVNNDHTPLVPPVVVKITVPVTAPSGY